MKFSEDINCQTCKYGYFKDISNDGWHILCGADNCYLCAENCRWCEDYEKGEIPEGKERV